MSAIENVRYRDVSLYFAKSKYFSFMVRGRGYAMSKMSNSIETVNNSKFKILVLKITKINNLF